MILANGVHTDEGGGAPCGIVDEILSIKRQHGQMFVRVRESAPPNTCRRFKWEHQRIGSSKQKTSRPVIRQEVFLIVTV